MYAARLPADWCRDEGRSGLVPLSQRWIGPEHGVLSRQFARPLGGRGGSVAPRTRRESPRTWQRNRNRSADGRPVGYNAWRR